MTKFSVILPTRNRPALFEKALRSVLQQEAVDFEVVVVNDGTSGSDAAALDAIKARYEGHTCPKITFLDLPITSGHGPFRVMNTGSMRATGDYLCFLDDDDTWTDPGHLRDAAAIIEGAGEAVDAVFFDQLAFRGETPAPGPIWLEDYGARLKAQSVPEASGAFVVDVAGLLTAWGFAHLNTSIVSRRHFVSIGGFDSNMKVEGDRDFYFRVIDSARALRYLPKACARHNIPDPSRKASVSTSLSEFGKALDQWRLLQKAVRWAAHPELVAYARRHRRYALSKAVDAVVSSRSPALLWRLVSSFPTMLKSPRAEREVTVAPVL